MPQNITDTETYHATIQTVADGDAANAANFSLAPQGLADRTAYLKQHMDDAEADISQLQSDVAPVAAHANWLAQIRSAASFTISGTSIAAGNKFTLTAGMADGQAFSLSNNEVEVPNGGLYKVTVHVMLENTASLNIFQAAALWRGGSNQITVRNGCKSDETYTLISFSELIFVAVPASDTLSVRASGNTGNVFADAVSFNRMIIERVGG